MNPLHELIRRMPAGVEFLGPNQSNSTFGGSGRGRSPGNVPGMRRSDQRREAVFALYQREVTGRALAELLEGAKPFTRELAQGVDAEITQLDEEIGRLARGWELERIATLERCIMRVALYEIRDRPDIPTEVAIDEAVNLAKEFCGADAPGFVNGILGSAARELEQARS